MKNKILLVGGTCSGKDTLLNTIYSIEYAKIITTLTTRPHRRSDGANIAYINSFIFEDYIANDKLAYYMKFGEHYYGTLKLSFIIGSVGISSPLALTMLTPAQRGQCTVIYLKCNHKTAFERFLKRYKLDNGGKLSAEGTDKFNDIWHNRLKNDIDMFKSFKDYDLIMDTSNV